MRVMGLHPLDLSIIIACLMATIIMGWWVSRGVKKGSDFLAAGKKMGGWLQFFLNFGTMTDASSGATVAAEVYRQGAGGAWINFQLLFATPFYWFTSVWFRRTRQITFADLFTDRFGGKKLAMFFAIMNLGINFVLMGMGNIVSYKVASAMIVKPESAYTAAEQASVDRYKEYQSLLVKTGAGKLSAEEAPRFQILDSMKKRGELRSYISYLKPVPFYLGYILVVAIYIMLGGIKAAAIIDAFQGLLLIIFSVMMIPMGLQKVGGFRGLHERVPGYKFELFGSLAASEYTWYTILAIIITSTIAATANVGPAQAAARDERVARRGIVGGGFGKRLMTIAWVLCGLLAVGLFPDGLSDTENAWGVLARSLLGTGLLGLMISGMILGNMPSVGGTAVNLAAMITRNIYEPIFKGHSDQHYVRVAKTSIPLVLGAGFLVTTQLPGVVAVLSFLITFGAFTGTSGILMYFWRKATVEAVTVGMVLWIILMGVLPWALPGMGGFRQSPGLLLTGQGRTVEAVSRATAVDVAAGVAKSEGEIIRRTQKLLEPALFFDSIARVNPNDLNSPQEGLGRFNVESFILYSVGLPVRNFNSADLLACRWGFDGLFPFLMLFVLSHLPLGRLFRNREQYAAYLRRREECNGRFFVKMKTPVVPGMEADARELEVSYANPRRFDDQKLFPRSSWEFCRWNRDDAIGFTVCWLLVFVIIGILWSIVKIGA